MLANKRVKVAYLGGLALAFALGLALFASISPNAVIPNGVIAGYSTSPCIPPTVRVQDSMSPSGFIDIYPASISYQIQVWHTSQAGSKADTTKQADTNFYVCNKLVVNDGLDILASIDGQNKTGSPAGYMTASTSSVFASTDTTCQGAQTTNGFTRQSVSGTYAHATGTATFTVFGQWTYTASSSTVIAGACLSQHSIDANCTGAAGLTRCLVDETALGSTATVNANGDILKITATITV